MSYFGKYRGTVANNIDPQFMGRIQVNCPAVLGDGNLSWAMPNAPLAGNQMGVFCVPVVGANVWVEFEGGDPDYPIYTGGFWGLGELPPDALSGLPTAPSIVLATNAGHTIAISDLPGVGGLTLKTASGAMITINDIGITITNGQGATISMTANVIDMNNGAFTVI